MAVRACTVSFKGVSGVRHSIDVEAESLYEAAIKAVARFREDPWIMDADRAWRQRPHRIANTPGQRHVEAEHVARQQDFQNLLARRRANCRHLAVEVGPTVPQGVGAAAPLIGAQDIRFGAGGLNLKFNFAPTKK